MNKRNIPRIGKCFDHLGGELAPILFNRLLEMEWIKPKEGKKLYLKLQKKVRNDSKRFSTSI